MNLILCLASYRNLCEYSWWNLLSVSAKLENTFKNLLYDYFEEEKISSNIPKLNEIANDVSCKVKNQYEQNRYPQWKTLDSNIKSNTISETISIVSLKIFDKSITKVKNPSILVAGCGTGQHPIITSQRFKNSNIIAIDLSLKSLGYAKRKTQEYGQNKIEYMQADILNLQKLNKKFDIVESVGVLHHMKCPKTGWKVLVDCLKDGGLMKIGLYSDFARQHISKIRTEIELLGLASEIRTIKFFRNKIFSSKKSYYGNLLTSPDFYVLNGFRDLVSHEQEHVFNLLEIQGCLLELGLKFCGFDSFEIVKNFKSQNFDENDIYDLEKWDIFEK